jgi:pilus assembly protein Flp/PilA
MTLFARFIRDDRGATAIEYGLIASLIAVAIIGAATTLGGKLSTTFTSVSNQLK